MKIPEEPKPTFVDLASPVLVDMLAKQLRKASALTVSEMLPDMEHAWLADGSGARYTSELRLVALDPVAWRPEATS